MPLHIEHVILIVAILRSIMKFFEICSTKKIFRQARKYQYRKKKQLEIIFNA